MKEPIEYLGNVNAFTTREELYNIGKQMQIDAIEESVKLCAENAQLHKKYYNIYDHRTMYERWKNKGYPRMDGYGSQSGVDVVSIDKESILKTAEQLISKL